MKSVLERLRAVPHLDLYASLTALLVGAALIVIAWGRTAALTDVSLQVPYVISAGVTGLAVVVAGLFGVYLSAKRSDAAARRDQMARLREQIDELRKLLEDDR